jgi:UDP-N-acetyl-D-mannosaminuronic acid transferase (WecB/TagA/CpsF family)
MAIKKTQIEVLNNNIKKKYQQYKLIARNDGYFAHLHI